MRKTRSFQAVIGGAVGMAVMAGDGNIFVQFAAHPA
jgi:hypothetical protein